MLWFDYFYIIYSCLSSFCFSFLGLYFCFSTSFCFVFFFFKQKTAYEMRISDWSSDVCSSDLAVLYTPPTDERARARWRGPYLDEAVPADPWGTPYQYSTPGREGLPFAIYSLGADGKPGGEGNDADIDRKSVV